MEKIKFFFQYLFSPIIIAVIGGTITYSIQKSQRRLEEMKFTEQIVKDAYDTSNVARGLAISLLIKPALRDNPEFADSLLNSITTFYGSRVKQAARNGNIQAIQDIQSASEDIGGDALAIAKKIKGSHVISKAEQATDFENQGFQLLKENKISEAKVAFSNAENTYNGFHNDYEIKGVLTDAEKDIKNQPKRLKQITDSVKNLIDAKYSWGKYEKPKQ